MSKKDLLKQAASHMAAAAELLNQLQAAKSFESQGLIDESRSNEEVERLLHSFRLETDEVSRLIDALNDPRRTC